MARSIHTTCRSWTEESLYDFSDEQKRQSRLDRLETDLEKKRRIKEQIKLDRRRQRIEQPVAPETIPIVVHDEGPLIHHRLAKLRRITTEAGSAARQVTQEDVSSGSWAEPLSALVDNTSVVFACAKTGVGPTSTQITLACAEPRRSPGQRQIVRRSRRLN